VVEHLVMVNGTMTNRHLDEHDVQAMSKLRSFYEPSKIDPPVEY